jgi:putative transcriptional regulator
MIVSENQMVKAGKIIIADPYLQDGEFTRSVILLNSYSKSGAIGFILNRPTQLLVHEAFNDFPHFNAPIYYGGPVDKNILFYVHTLGEIIPDSELITGTIYFGGDFNVVKKLIQENKINPSQIRFFLGYSGWSANQLEQEINDEAWLVGRFKQSYLFHKKFKEVWPNSLADNYKKHAFYGKFPYTPSLN